MKTKKAVAARYRVTASGKLKGSRPGKRHIMTKKSPKRKRQLSKPCYVDSGHLKTYKRVMCV
ncbi:MAG: 50S ribosomal protein L35 [Parachlamydiaceae bacterium]